MILHAYIGVAWGNQERHNLLPTECRIWVAPGTLPPSWRLGDSQRFSFAKDLRGTPRARSSAHGARSRRGIRRKGAGSEKRELGGSEKPHPRAQEIGRWGEQPPITQGCFDSTGRSASSGHYSVSWWSQYFSAKAAKPAVWSPERG